MSAESSNRNSHCRPIMEGDYSVSELEKIFLAIEEHEFEESFESSPDSIPETRLVPTISHIAKVAEEELIEMPMEARKILLRNIPLLSRQFSERFSREFNLPEEQTHIQTVQYEKIFTNLARKQGLLNYQSDHHRIEAHRLQLQKQSRSAPSWQHRISSKTTFYPQTFSAPARFCFASPKYTNNHQNEDFFRTPITENIFSSPVSTFSNFQTPFILDVEKYDSVVPVKEIEVETLEADTIEFIRHKNGDFYLVGEGTYGSVYLARMIDVSHLVCVKGYAQDLSPTTAIVHEAKILTYLHDTGLVPEFHGIVRLKGHSGDLRLVQEFCSNGITFRDLLKGPENQCKVRDRVRILYNMANGLKVLHQKKVLWNDIKANNVLVDVGNRHRVTFIDFGVASFKSGRRFYISGDADPFRFLAPEVREGFVTSQASDIYSLGYLMLKSLRNKPISQNLVYLMYKCLNDDPRARPSIQEIIKILDLFLQ